VNERTSLTGSGEARAIATVGQPIALLKSLREECDRRIMKRFDTFTMDSRRDINPNVERDVLAPPRCQKIPTRASHTVFSVDARIAPRLARAIQAANACAYRSR